MSHHYLMRNEDLEDTVVPEMLSEDHREQLSVMQLRAPLNNPNMDSSLLNFLSATQNKIHCEDKSYQVNADQNSFIREHTKRSFFQFKSG